MIKLKKIKLDKIKMIFKKLSRNLAEKAFLTFLKLFFISLIFGVIVFFQYIVLVKNAEPQLPEKTFQFKEKTYESVLKIWQERGETVRQTGFKQYPNPFLPK